MLRDWTAAGSTLQSFFIHQALGRKKDTKKEVNRLLRSSVEQGLLSPGRQHIRTGSHLNHLWAAPFSYVGRQQSESTPSKDQRLTRVVLKVN